jgi:hypothetical protein
MNKSSTTPATPEQTLASQIDYSGQGITIACGASCSCKNHLDETSKVKLSLWVRMLNRLKNPLHRSLASRLKD